MKLAHLADEARLTLGSLSGAARNAVTPTLRLGVTGLARSGKTVFITSLVHNLIHGGRLPLFSAGSGGRITEAFLQPQPDDAVPRFEYEEHVRTLLDDRLWPESTRQVSELRLTIDYESASYLNRKLGRGRLHLDIVDYPGEWLLDLPLLNKSYAAFSQEAMRLARSPDRAALAGPWLTTLASVAADGPEDEVTAQRLAQTFKTYLAACREDEYALSTLPPGRFLMPGDMEGSPALTFVPLDISENSPTARPGTLHAMMERRYESYRKHVVKPFFRNHFARLDRQIVLVDALQALNAGPRALHDLEEALTQVLTSFRPGKHSWLVSILSRCIDRVLFAATKADHLNRKDHDKLQALLAHLVARGMDYASYKGAKVETLAMAAVRATREATVHHHGEDLPAILGTPLAGETVDGETYDGKTEIALFPGDLPDDLDSFFAQLDSKSEATDAALTDGEFSAFAPSPVHYLRFRPPRLETTAEGYALSLPHIRLDRALEFLLGDRLA